MKQIELTQGKFSTVDDKDFALQSSFKWHAIRSGATWYAARAPWPRISPKTIFLHRQIMCAQSGMQVDHIDVAIVCPDDICAGSDHCMHGDGEKMCPHCNGQNYIYWATVFQRGGRKSGKWFVFGGVEVGFSDKKIACLHAVNLYKRYRVPTFTKLDLNLLRGKNLACWCPLNQPCHADVLLEIASK